MNLYSRQQNIVAGAGAEGAGVLLGWRGHGELTRARLLEILEAAGVPEDWAPAPKNAGVQLSRAVAETAGTRYTAERVNKGTYTFAQGERRWSSRWLLVARSTTTSVVGGAYGEVTLVATLFNDDDAADLIITTNDELLEARVREIYQSRIDAERYVAADITSWLGTTIRSRLLGARLGIGWYAPRETKAIARNLCAALREGGWGTSWVSPPIPVADTEDLSLALSGSLRMEVTEVIENLFKQRDAAKEGGKADISEQVAIGFMMQLRDIGFRMAEYETRLTPQDISECRTCIHDAMVELDKVLQVDPDTEWANIQRDLDAKKEAIYAKLPVFTRDEGQSQTV